MIYENCMKFKFQCWSIKFSWHTDPCIGLCSLTSFCGCFHAVMTEIGHWDRAHMATKPKRLIVWPLTRTVCPPRSMIKAFYPLLCWAVCSTEKLRLSKAEPLVCVTYLGNCFRLFVCFIFFFVVINKLEVRSWFRKNCSYIKIWCHWKK